jgi:hypothetical protein
MPAPQRLLEQRMRSFRLDRSTIIDALWLVPAVAIVGGVWSLGWIQPGRGYLNLVVAVLCVWPLLSGSTMRHVAARYPLAKARWLVGVGISCVIFCLCHRMLSGSNQVGMLDRIGVVLAFASLATFAIINRRDPDVWR